MINFRKPFFQFFSYFFSLVSQILLKLICLYNFQSFQVIYHLFVDLVSEVAFFSITAQF